MDAKQTQEAAKAWLMYQNSKQAVVDRQIDRQRRLASDKATGHLPSCTLSKCSADCGHSK